MILEQEKEEEQFQTTDTYHEPDSTAVRLKQMVYLEIRLPSCGTLSCLHIAWSVSAVS